MMRRNSAQKREQAEAPLRAIAGAEGTEGGDVQARLIHDRIRLAIVSALAVNESLSFSELKAILETTDGNLSVHARKLEEAGLIACAKSFEGRTPRTEFRITPEGQTILERYLGHMEALIKAVRRR
jgi:DNA-binding transcriptional ArsR family regulator